ncbi:hypothetical protein M8C21_017042, partial [Ambrosia artemisiifolia]
MNGVGGQHANGRLFKTSPNTVLIFINAIGSRMSKTVWSYEDLRFQCLPGQVRTRHLRTSLQVNLL